MLWVVRPLAEADVDDVCAVFRRSRAAAMPWLPILHTPDEDRRFFDNEIATSESWAADTDGVLLGFALRREGWLNHLYVDPASWRGGVGRDLLARVAQDAAEGLELWVFERNVAARAFYVQQRFVEVERTDGRGNQEREPDVRMRWVG